jgi:hypothetical protein
MKKTRLRQKITDSKPKLHPELRVHLLEAMMQALLIRKRAQPTSIKRLEPLERDYARVADRASGPMQALAKLSADATHLGPRHALNQGHLIWAESPDRPAFHFFRQRSSSG